MRLRLGRLLLAFALTIVFSVLQASGQQQLAAQPQQTRQAQLPPAPRLPLQSIRLPPGFGIELYADAQFPARFLALGQAPVGGSTVVFVSSANAGVITALVDRGGGAPVEACTLLSGLRLPNGIAYDAATGSLYVAAVDAMSRHDNVDAAALAGCDASLLRSSVLAALPPQASHGNRALAIGPDNKLYYTVAAPFNVDVCRPPYCTIHRMDKDGSGVEVFASGIRNAAGLAFHPASGDLLFAGMERDLMGNDRPDDILAALPGPGLDLQWPYCHWLGGGAPELRLPGPGGAIPDPQFTLPAAGQPRPTDAALAQQCADVALPPVQALGPHVAPLGVLFWPASGTADWPAQYDGSVFVAEHGSWNRDVPIGYRIANVQLSPDGRTAANHTVFADGWLPAGATSGEQAWGRPVGLLRLPDGSMLVADDKAQVVYRIGPGIVTTNGGGSTTPAAGTALLALLAAACMLLL